MLHRDLVLVCYESLHVLLRPYVTRSLMVLIYKVLLCAVVSTIIFKNLQGQDSPSIGPDNRLIGFFLYEYIKKKNLRPYLARYYFAHHQQMHYISHTTHAKPVGKLYWPSPAGHPELSLCHRMNAACCFHNKSIFY